ncbi:Phosphoglycerol transferase MdoB [Clostridium sp. USBA 49]|uniref:LTA synthase family protein n=1 Tax=Clostridium TaxID=1485 RepID=UPI0009995277|nr:MULTISPECIES: LTA synthase family protein [Clostridium]SKA90164.1 Phosphoglycerol transferase MdoB [Clostridium sp. USBA 49]
MKFNLNFNKLNLKKVNIKNGLPYVALFVLSFITFFIFQNTQLNEGLFKTLIWFVSNIKISIFNTIFIFFIYLLIISIAGNFTTGFIIGFIVFLIFNFANSQKLSILGEPIYPVDFYQVLEIKSLFKFVKGSFSLSFLIIFFVLLFAFVKAIKKLPRISLSLKNRVISIILSGFMLYSYLNFSNSFLNNILSKAGVTIVFWNQPVNYSTNGFMIALLSNLQNDIMAMPENYTEENVNKIALKYKEKAEEINKDRNISSSENPNIVFVMDESFWDPTKLTNLKFSDDPMKNIREIMSNSSSGALLSPSFGGCTANVEFEALTGFSMYNLFPGTVPFQQGFQKDTKIPSIASILKNDNYDTLAIHPYNKIFYKRSKVYPLIGFDYFTSEENIRYKDRLTKDSYISDQSVVNEILDVLNEKNNPQFIHAVTMQNHLPITDGKHGENSISISGLNEEDAKELETYSEGIKQSDIAIKNLIDGVSKLKEPTIVVFWGDHLPSLSNSIYEDSKYLGDDESLNERKLSETPLFIYSNYNLKKENLKTISPAFLGVTLFDILNKPLTPYYAMLEDIKSQVPGLKSSVLIDSNSNIKKDLSDDEKELIEEYKLIQYDLLLGKQYSLPLMFEK